MQVFTGPMGNEARAGVNEVTPLPSTKSGGQWRRMDDIRSLVQCFEFSVLGYSVTGLDIELIKTTHAKSYLKECLKKKTLGETANWGSSQKWALKWQYQLPFPSPNEQHQSMTNLHCYKIWQSVTNSALLQNTIHILFRCVTQKIFCRIVVTTKPKDDNKQMQK